MNKFSDQKKAPTTKPNHNDSNDQAVSTVALNPPAIVAEKTGKTAAPLAVKPDALKSKWKTKVSAAKSNWGKLSTSELLKSDGDAKTLAELVQLRYAIPLVEANKQVQRFLDKCLC